MSASKEDTIHQTRFCTSDLKMESESSSTTIASNSEVSFDMFLIKQEEKRLKRQYANQKFARKKKLLDEEDLKERKEKAIKGMNYLLSNSQKYSKFFIERLSNVKDPETKRKRNRKPLLEVNNNKKPKSNVTELNTDETEKLQESIREKVDNEGSTIVEKTDVVNNEQPRNFVGTLKKYQKEGLVWLKLLYENGVNGILADEMGLGKTIQIIALICDMIEKKIPGPYLVVAPLSTLPNWYSEFKRFAPKIPVVIFHGSPDVRIAKYKDIQKKYPVDGYHTAPVVITSYQIPLTETVFLKQFKWQYVIIDEGHRIKNYECKLVRALTSLKSLNRLLLTGTPLQNNLLELWSLLNFLLPQFFQDANTFSSLFMIEDFQQAGKIIEQEQNTNILSTIHGVLSPFMLRRLKVDVLTDLVPKKEVLVYCPLSDLQRNLYKYVLQKNISKLFNREEDDDSDAASQPREGRKRRKCVLKQQQYALPDSDDEFDENSPEFRTDGVDTTLYSRADKKSIICQVKLARPAIMLKKIVNHPFLVQCPVIPGTREMIVDEQVIEQSGKMMVLDAMLPKLKLGGHKVLIFSTFTLILDLIEDYMHIREYQYCRIDGTRNLENRKQNIEEFNTNPDKFVFLISTRAGGLGLNLTVADTVILYDRDWNPQVDIQAQDRCHRIGQTKPVVVYTFVTKGTIDERIITRAAAKRRLEKVVIRKGKFTNPELSITITDLKELEELLNSVDHNQVIHSNGYVLTNTQLKRLLDRSDLYLEMKRHEKNKEPIN